MKSLCLVNTNFMQAENFLGKTGTLNNKMNRTIRRYETRILQF